MQRRVTETRQSGVSLAEPPRKKQTAEAADRDADSPAERIRHAEELLRDLLLEDDFDDERNILCGTVSDGLSQLLLQMSNLAGKQELFELWIGR